jgi:hypothetical protein
MYLCISHLNKRPLRKFEIEGETQWGDGRETQRENEIGREGEGWKRGR